MDRIARSRRRLAALGLVCALALLLLVSVVVPAFGGPHALAAASPTSLAKKALRLAKSADKNSKEALKQARRVSAKGGPAGPQGIQGAPGQQGPAGPSGSDAFGELQYVFGGPVPNPMGEQTPVYLPCPDGTHVVGGGVETESPDPGKQEVNSTFPYDLGDPDVAEDDAWAAAVDNLTDPVSGEDLSFNLYAICTAADNVVAAKRSGNVRSLAKK